MSSEEEERTAEMERRDKRNERLERNIMIFQGVLALLALAAIPWWATGHYTLVPAWLSIVAIQAVMQIFSQKTIRLLRRANRDLYQCVRACREQLQEWADLARHII